MSEEVKEGAQSPEAKGGGGMVKIIILAVVLLGAGGGGFATYHFVLQPMLAAPDEEVMVNDSSEYIPAVPAMLELPDNYVNVIMEEDHVPASTLLYAVTFECNDTATADLITLHLARFIDMISKLHDSRMRSELDDIKNLKISIQREARQKANAILKQLQEKPSDDIMVTNVFHRMLMVSDQL